MRANINLYQGDCMEAMAKMSDNQYDLAIVDPPYGIGLGGGITGELKTNFGGKSNKIEKTYYVSEFDDSTIPDKQYFQELQRVSKHQIIWGGNYFINHLKNTPCFIVWDKDNGASNQADCELAWTNFTTSTRKHKYRWHGLLQQDMKNKEKRIHPTQKPVALYKWLLTNYAKEGDKILDTHGGSMSIALACWDLKFDLDLWELDEDYYKAGKERFERHCMQGQFDFGGTL